MLDTLGEFMRLYAWIAMPVFLAASFVWRAARNRAGLVALSPLILVWIAGRLITIAWGDIDSWAWDAMIDAFAALGLAFLAAEHSPRKALAVISMMLAAEVGVHCLYGVHLIADGYDKPTHRIYYWTTFAIAWGQVFVSAKWGGSRGKRQGVAGIYLRDAGDHDRAVRLRLANRLRAGGIRG